MTVNIGAIWLFAWTISYLFLKIARNVIAEKENNMKSIKESLEAEKEQKVKLEKVNLKIMKTCELA